MLLTLLAARLSWRGFRDDLGRWLRGESQRPEFEPIAGESAALLNPDMGATGVLGDPSAGDARLGTQFLAATAEALATYLDQIPNPTNGVS